MPVVRVKPTFLNKIPQAEELLQEAALRRILGQSESSISPTLSQKLRDIKPKPTELLFPPQGRLSGVVGEYFDKRVIPQAQFLKKPAQFIAETAGMMTRPSQMLIDAGTGIIGGIAKRVSKKASQIFDLNLSPSKEFTRKIEIIKNPSSNDIKQMAKEFRRDFPGAISGTPALRSTFDKFGNEYLWRADKAIHFEVETALKKKFGLDANQNKYFDTSFFDIKKK